MYQVIDMNSDSRYNLFTLKNIDKIIYVKTKKNKLFLPSQEYDISTSLDLHVLYESYHGVVTYRNRQSTKVQTGGIMWIFPVEICDYIPGIDVWVNVCLQQNKL